jgi:NitT/TauT family transport system substrate-binding protein
MGNSLLLQEKVDGVLQWFTTLVPILESKGGKIHYLKYSDLGINVHSNSFIANLKTIQERPDLVKKFLRAMAKGYKLTRQNPNGSIAALVKYNPKATGKEAVLSRQLELSLDLWVSKNTKDKPIGWIDEKEWDAALDVLKDVGWIDNKLAHSKYYTNEFNPGIKWK